MRVMRGLWVMVAVVALLAGCGPKTEETAQSPAPVDNSAAAPDTAVAAAGWLDQVRVAEAGMVQAVEQGRLADVHGHAENLVAVLGRATSANPDLTAEQQSSLNAHATAARHLADELHAAADAGDLTKAKTKLGEFRTHMRGIESAFSAPTP